MHFMLIGGGVVLLLIVAIIGAIKLDRFAPTYQLPEPLHPESNAKLSAAAESGQIVFRDYL